MSGPWLLLGGDGYVGRHVKRELDRRGVPHVSKDAEDADFSRDIPSEWLEAASLVLLLAGRTRAPDRETLLRDNRDIAVRTLEAYERATRRPPLFFPSSLHVYTPGPEPHAVGDSVVPPRSAYGAVKLAVETLLSVGARRIGFPLFIGRAANLVALEEPLNSQSFVADMRRTLRDEGEIRVRGSPVRDLVLVADLVAGLLAVEAGPPPAGGVRLENVCTGRPIDLEEVARAAADLASGRVQVEPGDPPDRMVGVPFEPPAWGSGPNPQQVAALIAS